MCGKMGDHSSDQYVEPSQPPEIPPRRRLSTEVEHLPYYNPDVRNMDEVREAMMPYLLQDGYFMLRSSFSKPGIYTVSIMHQRSIKHFNIGRTAHSFFLQDKHFSTITQLMQHYGHEDVPNLEGVRHIQLRYPIRYIPDQLSSVRASFHHSFHMDVPSGMQRNDALVSRSPVRKTAKLKPHDACGTKKLQGCKGKKSAVSLPSTGCGAVERYTVRPPPRNVNPSPGRDRCQSDSSYDCQRLPGSQENADRLSGQHSASTSSVTSSSSFLYDKVRNVDVDRTSELISLLRLEESRGSAKCDCGLYEEESELPLGWSVHISHEQQSYGRVFFMSPEGQTAWNLPLQVSLLLSTEQQDQIRSLLNGFRPDLTSPQQPEVASGPAARCTDNANNNDSTYCIPTAGTQSRQTPKVPETLLLNAKLPHEPVAGNNCGDQHACDVGDDDDDVFT